MGTVRDAIGRWRRKVGEATRKAEDLAGNTWQHCEFYFFQSFLILMISKSVFNRLTL